MQSKVMVVDIYEATEFLSFMSDAEKGRMAPGFLLFFTLILMKQAQQTIII